MDKLGIEVQTYNTLKERIKAEYNLDSDDPCLADTVNGEVSIEETILNVARDIKRTEAFAAGMKLIINDNKDRLSRLEQRAERLRRTIIWALQETGLKKVEAADTTVSQHAGLRGVSIYDETIVPLDYCQVKYTPCKTQIRKALEEKTYVPGAQWSNAPTILTIRTR